MEDLIRPFRTGTDPAQRFEELARLYMQIDPLHAGSNAIVAMFRRIDAEPLVDFPEEIYDNLEYILSENRGRKELHPLLQAAMGNLGCGYPGLASDTFRPELSCSFRGTDSVLAQFYETDKLDSLHLAVLLEVTDMYFF